MQHVATLTEQVRYHQDRLRADADRARLRRAVRTHTARRSRWLTSRDATRIRADLTELATRTTATDSPQWPLQPGHPRRAEVR